MDILKAKIILRKATSFPPELIDTIMDYAEHWLHTSVSFDELVSIQTGSPNRENKIIVCLPSSFFTRHSNL